MGVKIAFLMETWIRLSTWSN